MKTLDLAKIEAMTAVDIYTNGGIEPIMQQLKDVLESFEHDMSTAKGRDATRALSSDYSKAKAALERAADTLTEDARKLVKSVNAVKKDVSERCAAYRDQARQPLTDYENELERLKEQEKVAAKKILDEAEAHYLNDIFDQALDQEKRQAELDLKEQAMAAREAAIEVEKQKLADAENERIRLSEKAEADRLQAIEDEKQKVLRAEREAQEAEDRRKLEDERMEAAVIKAKNDERARNEQVAAQELAEKLKREEDKRIRTRVHNAIIDGLTLAMSDVATGNVKDAKAMASSIVTAISDGKIPHVSITY